MARKYGSRNSPALPTLPEGSEVASYRTYAQAQQGVDHLADEGFPVRNVTIVGTDLQMVERITGRLTIARVATAGAMSGMWFGLFISMFLLFLSPEVGSVWLVAAGTIMGALFGMVFGVIPYLLSGGKRDFTSSSQVVASRYAVLASQEIERARSMLENSRGNLLRREVVRPKPTGPSVFGTGKNEKPRFGVRLNETEKAELEARQKAEKAAAEAAAVGKTGPATDAAAAAGKSDFGAAAADSGGAGGAVGTGGAVGAGDLSDVAGKIDPAAKSGPAATGESAPQDQPPVNPYRLDD